MRKINYKSDFDFLMRLKDSAGKDVPFPECDWDAVFWTSSKARAYTASCKGGIYTNCFRTGDGDMHFIFNNHCMGLGTLHWEPHFELPNDLYPDGIQDLFRKAVLDIELADGYDDDVTDIPDVEVYMPAVYLTAYDLAVRNGYTGTYEEYVEYTNRFPQVVETAETVNNILSDFADGKAMIADALTKQGLATSASESMQSMARKVLDMHLAVDGEPGYVPHLPRLGRYDLYNEMYNHQIAEFPYMYAVSFDGFTVNLSGADAYLCSDGYYTTEDGQHTFQIDGTERYVIYYSAKEKFTTVNFPTRPINTLCVYNGSPALFISGNISTVEVYGDKPLEMHNNDDASISSTLSQLSWESLQKISGGTLLNWCAALSTIALPNLTEVRLKGVSNFLVARINQKEVTLDMPELRSAVGLDQPWTSLIANGGTSHIHIPKCEDFIIAVAYDVINTTHLYVGNSIRNLYPRAEHAAANRAKCFIHAPNGIVSAIRTDTMVMDADNLHELISNLGDNTGNETLALQFGSANLALISDEDKAVATSKNYSLS